MHLLKLQPHGDRTTVRVVTIAALLTASLLVSPPATRADETALPMGASLSGIAAASWQHADGSRSSLVSGDGEANAQLDVLLGLPMGPGAWHMEVKAGTTPRNDRGVSAVFPEATGLVGETVNSSGQGQGAITQLYYGATPHFANIDAGLLFVPAYIDTNEIADDEYRQFMGTTFVNNPTIAMPVYVIGAAAVGPVTKAIGYTAFVSSTADLQGSTYGNLFDFNGKGHGVFAAGEVDWAAAGYSGNIGLWHNSDDSNVDLASGRPRTAWGTYTNVNGTLGSDALRWNVRLGWANPRVSAANTFIAGELAYDTRLSFPRFHRPITYGLGISHTGVSSHLPGPKADREQVEVYARLHLTKHLSATADLQYLRHSQFDPAKRSDWIEGVRMAVEF